MDNSGDIAGALVTRIPESRWWRDDTSPAGYSSDCSGNSPGVWPAHGLGDLGRAQQTSAAPLLIGVLAALRKTGVGVFDYVRDEMYSADSARLIRT